MKVICVAGARPNFVKIAPIMLELRKRDGVTSKLVHTGQHYDDRMSHVFFQELGIPPPDYNLNVGGGSHAVQTASIMQAVEPVLAEERPDLVLVVGDVNSTVACAITAAKMLVPVGHVEAGLRSFDRTMPEEINRILTDAIADLLFTTEKSGSENLLREGVSPDRIFFTGNVMIDALLRHRTTWSAGELPRRLGLEPQRYGVLTLHRPSNVDDRDTFEGIARALRAISEECPIVFPCHPRTRKRIVEFGLESYFTDMPGRRGIYLTDAVGYFDFLGLMATAQLVLTDSGGIQEETTVLGVPCVTLRENTERPVTVEEGTNILAGTDEPRILAAVGRILRGEGRVGRTPALWDGRAAERIVDIILSQCVPAAAVAEDGRRVGSRA